MKTSDYLLLKTRLVVPDDVRRKFEEYLSNSKADILTAWPTVVKNLRHTYSGLVGNFLINHSKGKGAACCDAWRFPISNARHVFDAEIKVEDLERFLFRRKLTSLEHVYIDAGDSMIRARFHDGSTESPIKIPYFHNTLDGVLFSKETIPGNSILKAYPANTNDLIPKGGSKD